MIARAFAILGLLWLSVASAFAQETGSVTGVVVSSWDAAALPGVVVTVRGTTLATQTDQSGRFELKNAPVGEQVVRFSKPGFAGATVTEVRILPGQATTVNGNLRPEFFDMEEYEVTAEEFTEQTEKILFERQQAGALMDAIGSEQFTRLNASDAGQIVGRVTGVSVVGGKYAVVRGLSDRYTRTLLNGMEVPSADPYRLSPQLDLFPSAMIDKISVSKTFTPDQPGGTGGGTIDITTKSFPEKPFVKFSTGLSYNENSNLKDNFLADPKSNMKMFGLASGPDTISSDLFGLVEAPPRPGSSSSQETPARAETRRGQADAVTGLLQELGTTDFAGVERTAPLNTSMAASAGETTKLFDRSLGVFGGLNYRREFRAIDAATVGRYSPDGTATRTGAEQRGNINTDFGATVNLGYDLWPGSKLGFNFMLAQSTDEEARHTSFGFVEGRDDSLEQWQLHYTDREIQNYQISGHHEMPSLWESEFNWVVGIANTSQNEPDQRFMNYFLSDTGQASFGDASTPFPQFPSRYFREISETGLNARGDWSIPFDFLPADSKFKTGFFSTGSNRDFREQYFSYSSSSGFDPANPNSYLNDPAYLQYIATNPSGIRTNYAFPRFIADTFAHPYTASMSVTAGYFMVDAGLLSWLRFIGGVRVEATRLELDAGRDGSAAIQQTDLLPAATFVASIITNLDVRLSYGQTVSRPSYREIAPVQSYLPDLNITALGEPSLRMIAIKSYDARIEWFPSPGDVVSAGVFYKQLKSPIELISRTLDDQQVTWQNRDSADLAGVEFEARKGLEFVWSEFKGLSLGANVTIIQSSTPLSDTELINKQNIDPNADDSRPLYDQSPYIINLDTTYEIPGWGTTLTTAVNMTGERIVLSKTQGPDIYEHPPMSLDCAISQKIGKYWTFRFGVRNVLDSDFRQTYGSNFEGNIYQSYKRGRTYGFSLSADF
jgi:TonB-dependent receptor